MTWSMQTIDKQIKKDIETFGAKFKNHAQKIT